VVGCSRWWTPLRRSAAIADDTTLPGKNRTCPAKTVKLLALSIYQPKVNMVDRNKLVVEGRH
jgi:hypothetical protein